MLDEQPTRVSVAGLLCGLQNQDPDRPKPGKWFAPPDVEWSPTAKNWSVVDAIGFYSVLGVAAIAHMDGAWPFVLYLVSVINLRALQTRPKDIERCEPLRADEFWVEITVYRWFGKLGVDEGPVWFQDDCLMFSGKACSFVLARQDFTWSGYHTLDYGRPFRLGLPSAGKKLFGSLYYPPIRVHIRSESVLDFTALLRRLPPHGSPSVERQLPPTGKQPSQSSKLRWTDYRMWLPILPTSPEEFPIGGVTIAIAWFWLATYLFGGGLGIWWYLVNILIACPALRTVIGCIRDQRRASKHCSD